MVKYLLGRAAILGVGIKKCKKHDLQIDIQAETLRLIYDRDFGWLFYNPVDRPKS